MEIVLKYPPNYDNIVTAIPAVIDDKNAIFCYGDKIYNPYNREITEDLKVHEYVHAKQQKEIGVDEWWKLYLTDKRFRLEQEIEAYGEQYRILKKSIEEVADELAKEGKRLTVGVSKIIKHGLERMAKGLSSDTYGGIISYSEAESKIRNYGKTK